MSSDEDNYNKICKARFDSIQEQIKELKADDKANKHEVIEAIRDIKSGITDEINEVLALYRDIHKVLLVGNGKPAITSQVQALQMELKALQAIVRRCEDKENGVSEKEKQEYIKYKWLFFGALVSVAVRYIYTMLN